MSRGTPISFSADMNTEATNKFISLSSLSPASPLRLSSPFNERLRRELPQVRRPRRSFATPSPPRITLCPHRATSSTLGLRALTKPLALAARFASDACLFDPSPLSQWIARTPPPSQHRECPDAPNPCRKRTLDGDYCRPAPRKLDW